MVLGDAAHKDLPVVTTRRRRAGRGALPWGMRRPQTDRFPLSVAAVAWARAASRVVGPVHPGLGACSVGGVVRALGRVVAWREDAAPGGSSLLEVCGPTAASTTPTADVPAAAPLLVLIGRVGALMFLCGLIAILLGLTIPRLRAQEILQVTEFVKQSAWLYEALHFLFMAELAETGVEGANLVSGNGGLEEAEDLLVGYAGDLC